MNKIDKRLLMIFIAIPIAVGALSSLIVGKDFALYSSVNSPPLSPPMFVFPIVWAILYILMGISSYIIFQKRNEKNEIDVGAALMLYALSLVLNASWTLTFFKAQNFLAAFAILIVLIIVICSMIFSFTKISKTAAFLQLPYLLWCIFAAYLNLSVYFLNN